MPTTEEVFKSLENVQDPELQYNIVDLGLVYDVKVEEDGVTVLMTFTTPMCPVGPLIKSDVEQAVARLEGVKWVHVEIVWDPPWSAEKMSDEAKMALGLM